MAVDFRCEKCGKLLSLDAQPGQEVKCPHCQKRITVPQALASLPRPQVPPGAGAAPAGEGEQQQVHGGQGDAVMNVMAQVMPWVISVFFHLGLALIMMFFAIIVQEGEDQRIKPPESAAAPRRSKVTKRRHERPSENPLRQKARQPLPTLDKATAQKQDKSLTGSGLRQKMAPVIGASGSAGPGGRLAETGLPQPGGGGGVRFMDRDTVRAEDVVYLIDKSGSMTLGGAFETLQVELSRSIGGLDENQKYHLIFFGKEEPLEAPPRNLVFATPENKMETGEFIKSAIPEGSTILIPSLKRAFEVLLHAPDDAEKLICLLSDGDFEGVGGATNVYGQYTGNEAVVQWLNDHNPKIQVRDESGNLVTRRKVRIFTFLYRGDEQSAIDVMKKIAAEHNGEFYHIK